MVGALWSVILLGAGGDLSEAGAVTRVERIIRSAGISGDLKLNSCRKIEAKAWGYGDGKIFQVAFDQPQKHFVQALIRQDGKLLQIQFLPYPGQMNGTARQPNSDTARFARRADELVRLFGAKGNYVRQPFVVGGGNAPTGVQYKNLLNGMRFFNLNPTYGYRVTFQSDSLVPIDYFSSPDFPPVIASTAVITKEVAIRKLEHWGKTHYRSGGGAAYLYGPDWKVKVELRPELGYYKFANEPKARLVWFAQMWTKFNGAPKAVESGYLKMMVDAVTGDLKMVDDPGMN